ncbi:hypothetical protein ACTXT7_006247 [Hymenolepis weldensis]
MPFVFSKPEIVLVWNLLTSSVRFIGQPTVEPFARDVEFFWTHSKLERKEKWDKQLHTPSMERP